MDQSTSTPTDDTKPAAAPPAPPGRTEVKLRRKYRTAGVAKTTKRKGSGNSGLVGKKGKRRQRAPR